MGHTLHPLPVTPTVRQLDPGAKAYRLGDCKVLVTRHPVAPGCPPTLHVSISRVDRARLPTLEEVSEICAKVPEIDRALAVYINAHGQGVVPGSKVVQLWEWSTERPTHVPPVASEN